jgi:hypothetical protein
MNEPTKENPKAPKRSKRRPAMEPLGWDEIVSQPGMGGYLSFLNGPIPLPHLQGAAPATVMSPGVISTHGPSVSVPAITSAPEVDIPPANTSSPGSLPYPGPRSPSEDVLPPEIESTPVYKAIPGSSRGTAVSGGPAGNLAENEGLTALAPEVVLASVVTPVPRLRIRRCAASHDGHSLGEEVLYQSLWKAARPESIETSLIVIGWRGMSQLCRMTPKNCKINTHRLIHKLALEVLSPYNTPESIGTTYRVYSDQAILQRRRDAGLEWVVRSRGVEFVDPATGNRIMPICAPTHRSSGPKK